MGLGKELLEKGQLYTVTADWEREDMGLEPEMIRGVTAFFASLGGTAVCGSICCLTGIVVAAVLGAIGAASFAATKSK